MQVGKSGCGAVIQPHRGHIGASNAEALRGSGGEGEGPLLEVGVTARVAWSCGGVLGVGNRRRARG